MHVCRIRWLLQARPPELLLKVARPGQIEGSPGHRECATAPFRATCAAPGHVAVCTRADSWTTLGSMRATLPGCPLLRQDTVWRLRRLRDSGMRLTSGVDRHRLVRWPCRTGTPTRSGACRAPPVAVAVRCRTPVSEPQRHFPRSTTGGPGGRAAGESMPFPRQRSVIRRWAGAWTMSRPAAAAARREPLGHPASVFSGRTNPSGHNQL